MFELHAKFHAESSLYSLSHLECDGHTVHMLTQWPHWLVQWSHHCSRMCIPVHSPWLPGYIDVTQTVLVILTIAGLFPDRPHMWRNLLPWESFPDPPCLAKGLSEVLTTPHLGLPSFLALVTWGSGAVGPRGQHWGLSISMFPAAGRSWPREWTRKCLMNEWKHEQPLLRVVLEPGRVFPAQL